MTTLFVRHRLALAEDAERGPRPVIHADAILGAICERQSDAATGRETERAGGIEADVRLVGVLRVVEDQARHSVRFLKVPHLVLAQDDLRGGPREPQCGARGRHCAAGGGDRGQAPGPAMSRRSNRGPARVCAVVVEHRHRVGGDESS